MFKAVKKLISAVFPQKNSAQRILQSFEGQRQQLRDDFFAKAATSGKPRGLIWKNCTWLDTFTLVEESSTGIHTPFCGVNLSFEAVEGGDMEDVEAVSMIREGSAVFHHQNGRWGSGGRVLFNMDPQMAAQTMATGQVSVAHSSTETKP